MTNGASPFAWVLRLLALLFLALFAGVWLWVAWKLHRFTPSTATPKLEFSDAVASTAGLLASGVGAGTASVLGIQIQKDKHAHLAARVAGATKSSWVLTAGILIYVGVGVVNLLVWLGNSSVAPEMIAAFSLGALAWLAGAFSAVFAAN
jgi:hypothetical protein